MLLVAPLALGACASGSAARAGDAAGAPTPAPRASIVKDGVDGDVREVELSNGLRVLMKEDRSAPVATLVVYYKAGSRNEYVGNTGSSHLLEHLLFKGSAKFPGRDTIMNTLSRVGASFNATTYYDRTNYYATVPSDQLPLVIELEADRMRNATFSDDDRSSEMTVVRNELERGENNPGRVLSHQLWATAIMAHPYHHPVIGWRSDVENVPTSQLRSYYDTYYQPGNAVVAVVGDFDADQTLSLIVEKFGAYEGGHEFPEVYTAEEPQRGERRFVIRKPGEISIVKMGWLLPEAMSPDTVPLKLLQLVLAGTLDINEFGDPLSPGIGNRLYQSLVEKQLATSAGMSYVLMIDPTVGSLTAYVRPGVSHDTVEKALRAEVAKLRDEPVTDAELARAKSRARAAFGLSQDGTFGQAMALGYFGLIGDWRFVRDFADKVDAVTAEDIQRVAQKYFHDDATTVGWYVPTSTGGDAVSGPSPSRHHEEPTEPAISDAGAWDRTLSFGSVPQQYRPADDAAEAREVEARALTARDAARTADRDGADGDGGDVASADGSGGAATKIHRRTLSNGLRILVQENPSRATFALQGAVLAGSAFEKENEDAVAGITADMLERGTTKRSKLELAAVLEETGASLGIGGGFESASISALALGEDLDRVIDVLAEQILHPAFPQDELDKLKEQRIARIQQSEDSTSVKARRALAQGIYPKNHPRWTRDPDESVKAIRAIDRAAIRRWHQTWWGPDRTVLTFVGNVKAEDVFAKLEERLSDWKPVGGPTLDAADVALPEQGERKVIFVPEKSNVDIFFGHHVPVRRTDDAYYATMLGNHILGGGSSGRLFKTIRGQMGLTYGIYSGLSTGRISGPWTVSLTVNPNVVDQAIGAVNELLVEWSEKGITEKELADAKSALVGQYKVGLASNGGLAGSLTAFEVLGLGAEFVHEHPKRIEDTTIEQVNAAIRSAFAPGKLLTVISGTWNEAAAESSVDSSVEAPKKQ